MPGGAPYTLGVETAAFDQTPRGDTGGFLFPARAREPGVVADVSISGYVSGMSMQVSVKLLVLTAAVALPFTANAEIYKYVDSNGVVRYTDKPPSKNAKPLDLPPVQTYTGVESGSSDASDDNELDSILLPTTVNYQGIVLTSPSADQVFSTGNPQVTASAQVEPGLQAGHRVVFLVDGLPFPAPEGESSTELSGLNRGSHTLQAVVMDSRDSIQAQSEPINFQMNQPSLQKPPADLTVIPNAQNPDYTGDGVPDPRPVTPTAPQGPSRPKIPGQGAN